MTKRDCRGCVDNFYNGHNQIGVPECWMFKGATLVLRREVGMDERPPWTRTPTMKPNCYRKKGSIFVRPEVEL